jgi:hypothetical protein
MVQTMAEPSKNLKIFTLTLHYHARFKTGQIWKGIRFKVTYSEYEEIFSSFFVLSVGFNCSYLSQSPYAENETMMPEFVKL